MLIDCGANVECTPEYLLQFAYLGSYYAQRVMGIEKPRVGLLNIGAEEEKGDTLRHETYALLKEAGEAGRIHFIGNVEANEAMMGTADVIVTDGFTGNVMLKTMEGVGKFLLKSLKEMFLSSTKTKLAAGLVKGDLGQMKKLLDPSEVGGTFFRCPGAVQRGAAGQGVCGKRFHRGHSGQHRTHAGPARHGKKLISY